MILKTQAFSPNKVIQLCNGCVTDNNGGKIALTIIMSSLILLAIGNWAWKKYFSNKQEISQEK